MSKSINTEIEAKGIEAAKRFLSKRGMEILNDEPFECEAGAIEIIAKDEGRGGLVFVKVVTRISDGGRLPIANADEETRGRLERIAVAFLESYDETGIGVFFDEIAITAISADRGLLRHHINMMGSAN